VAPLNLEAVCACAPKLKYTGEGLTNATKNDSSVRRAFASVAAVTREV